MKIMIEGDTEHAHLVAASKAIDEHKKKYGTGNKYPPFTYCIRYRKRLFQVEVTNSNKYHLAHVITGHRELTKVHYGERD
ncbi:DUF4060 family protein [Rouxiella badensis]|jgi:hypothetical protein|uniref:DUF4060 family protein n=1 Tax=Rouxiella badensis TaxID=1646377 RepID=UPI0013EF39AA|nr:DUF4060 family protein [Rouxiella badensis]MCC3704959.1 DUF4060 family protein [Rouxiella badensis]QII38142.1 DUF4060 family protein [Rouxiella badensis]QOI55754.1 DUF4060 family protein [Rouxiella badensis subsp. acadiensis]WAT09559.1 DUF4060 family protein [Rouxiella badensis]